MNFPKIDVVIPFYNATQTLARTVHSVLSQSMLGTLWLVDDASTDQGTSIAQQFAAQYPQVRYERLPQNSGVAKARNWGALQSMSESAVDFVAFLDADDAYENGALEVASSVFHFRPETNLVRLALKPVGIAERYLQQANFEFAWQHMRMTCGGNTVFRKSFFFACGGFPQHQVFRELGGEDGALGIATTKISAVATVFNDVGVLHYCREGMFAYRLLDSILFNRVPEGVTAQKMAEAEAVTEQICQQIQQLKTSLQMQTGIFPLTIERNE